MKVYCIEFNKYDMFYMEMERKDKNLIENLLEYLYLFCKFYHVLFFLKFEKKHPLWKRRKKEKGKEAESKR